MVGRLVLLCALGVLVVGSLRTEVTEAEPAPTQTPIATPTPTLTATLVVIATASPTPTAVSTLVPTPTPAATSTATLVPTATVTLAPSSMASVSATLGPTSTPIPTATSRPSSFSLTPLATPTRPPYLIFTLVPTWTVTPTTTPTGSPTGATTTTTPTPSPTGVATLTGTPGTPGPLLVVATPGTPGVIAPTGVPPLLLGISVSSITRSSATVNWTTNLPATSQVTFGIAAAGDGQSPVDASLVTNHAVVLNGLLPGTAYHYRALSVSAGGASAASIDAILLTAPPGSGPEIGSIQAQRLTSTTALIGWATATGTVGQVEYGATANYGAFTLLQIYPQPTQQLLLSGLIPGAQYHFRIKEWDGSGNLSASSDATFTTAIAGPATLIGDQTVEPQHFSLAAGQAAAYQYVAAQSGQASVVRVYLDAGSNAPAIRVALYSDAGGSPGTLLSQGSAPGLTAGWLGVQIPPVSLISTTRYWVVVLSPIGSGTLNLRDAGLGGSSLLSNQTTLAALPAAWTTGTSTARAPMSAYVLQVPPVVTLLGPTDGGTVNGNVPLSAVVDDDSAITQLQFLVDGVPVGTPLVAAPFTTVWDSSGASASQAHMVSARASDALGRTSTSSVTTVQVDNGPNILGVSVSQGLTASSARVTWTTDVVADGQVEFGPTLAYGLLTPVDPRTSLAHDMQVTGLVPGAVYHYRVRSRDASGAVGVSTDRTFFTAEP